MEDDMVPTDPVSENQNILKMKPVKAFIEQNHEAHIAVHMAAMQDPKIMQLVQSSPLAQQIGAAMSAHIAEHLGFEYRKQIEATLGMPLPPMPEPGEDAPRMDPKVAAQVAQMSAQAAQQLLQKNVQEVQAQQAQQQMQDPIIQMQMKDQQIKEADLQRKVKKDLMDAAAKVDQQDIERERIASQQLIAEKQIMVKAAKDVDELDTKRELEGAKLTADVVKTLYAKNKKGNN
jgi:hypothetical protein